MIRRYLTLAGAAVLLIGCFLPWADYAYFPGKMSLAFSLSGARLYCMLLALPALLSLTSLQGARRAVRPSAYAALGISLITALLIGWPHRGLGHVMPGAWVAVAGAVIYVVGSVLDRREEGTRALPGSFGLWEPVLVLAFVGLALFVFVKGLGIPTSTVAAGTDYAVLDRLSLNKLTGDSQFLDFVILIVGLSVTASRIRVFAIAGELNQRHRHVLLGAAVIAAMAFPFTQHGSAYSLRICATVGVFAAAAVGLNVVVGLAGLLDLGYIAFFGIGAYFAALFSGTASSVTGIHLPFIVVLPLAAATAGIFGVLLGAPTLRLRGDYLAIVTLGFGEIFRIASNNLDGNAGPKLTNGPNGISDVPDLKLGSYDFGNVHHILGVDIAGFANYYWLEVVLLIAFMTAFFRLAESRVGRAWVAIREDELAAAATGIDTTRLKLLAFGIGATIAGAAGAVDGHVLPVATPSSFTFLQSATLLAAVILGGMGTVPGALLGSTVLIMLPEKLRFLDDLRLLVFGLALVLIMRLRPEGLVPSKRRQREFHETDPTVLDRSGSLDPAPGAAS